MCSFACSVRHINVQRCVVMRVIVCVCREFVVNCVSAFE
jgi:hypothetical protein